MKQKQEEKKTGRPAFDGRKCQEVAGTIAVRITTELSKSKPQSIADGLLMMTLATGRVIHVLGALMGVDPKRICHDFCESLNKYFELGGDGVVDEVVEAFMEKGN